MNQIFERLPLGALYSPSKRGKSILFYGLAYKYLAVYIKVQGLQNKPKESERLKNPQRKSFSEAIAHFNSKFESKCPGLTMLISHIKFKFLTNLFD